MGSLARVFDRRTLPGLLTGLLLIAAMTGLFFYERTQFGEYPLSWELSEAGSESASGTLDEGGSATHTFTLAEEVVNVARIRVTVTWTDDVGDPDAFSVQVTPPNGETGSAGPETSGNVEAVVDLGTVPDAATAPGRDPDDAAEQAATQYESEAGHGEWTVTVTLDDAPGTGVAGSPVEAQPDGSNDYTVTFAWDVYEPNVGSERL